MVLLKDIIYGENGILLNDNENFTEKRTDIIKKFARDEKMIKYNDLLFKTGVPIIINFDF